MGSSTVQSPVSYDKAKQLQKIDSFSSLPMLSHNHQFGTDQEHFLSKNAVVICGDSITVGANAGYYMDNGYAYKVKRALMDAYKSRSYGYINVADENGFEVAPSGAYRWYEPSTTGEIRENENAVNAIGGVQVTLGAGEYFKYRFNRADRYSREYIKNQNKVRIVFNDSSGSVRVTASGIGYTMDEVVVTEGTGISDALGLPPSWDGEITITNEAGEPVVNGAVFLFSEDDYCVHVIANGGRALTEISDDTLSKIITGADLYIHSLGMNDTWGSVAKVDYDAKITTCSSIINASEFTRVLICDFIWTQNYGHFGRVGLRRLKNRLKREALYFDVPRTLANGGQELSAGTLSTSAYRFLSSDEVHPFINGHNFIAGTIKRMLGIDPVVEKMPTSADQRTAAIESARLTGFSFRDELSRMVVGWTSDGNNSIDEIEGGGVTATGYIYAAFIETKIPVVEDQRYMVEIDIENIDSVGQHNFGTRSLDALGNEIWEQDNAGNFSGNLSLENLTLSASERRIVRFYVGGINSESETNTSKFEPGAVYWNLGLTLNNGDAEGSLIVHSIRILPVITAQESYKAVGFLNDWVSSNDDAEIDIEHDSGVVTFTGFLQGGAGSSSGSSVFVIPAHLRPSTELEFRGLDENGGVYRIRVETGGYIRVYGTGVSGWNSTIALNIAGYKV